MIELIASAPDGWAIVRDHKGLWILRPPYGLEDRDPQTDLQVARALAHEDFVFRHLEFEGWGSLCRQLQEERIEHASAEELRDAEEVPSKILSEATAEQVESHLEAIEEALRAGHFGGARDVLLTLMKADSVRASKDLYDRILGMLEEAIQERRRDTADAGEPDHAWKISNTPQLNRQAEVVRANEGFMNTTSAA